ncbi:hypothetical protein DFP72DRAFT_848227 [Ephemerocybe angulata]|uniref:Nephrocystin 3-like N-terminal domain-containing protein n=1 Tax=Ephemerocybe angulata TaxID=980116 RepID=A0A8H6M3N5_9AGAR|nr:hypothetical protein DFP72DRAFT_848227 [Tulosesus angulatus]
MPPASNVKAYLAGLSRLGKKPIPRRQRRSGDPESPPLPDIASLPICDDGIATSSCSTPGVASSSSPMPLTLPVAEASSHTLRRESIQQPDRPGESPPQPDHVDRIAPTLDGDPAVYESPILLETVSCTSKGSGSNVFFPNASNFHIENFQYIEQSHRPTDGGWDLLQKRGAPKAHYDSSTHFDAPKCDEDTRVEILAEIMNWAQEPGCSQRLLCITGPAGAGKSAIQQTVAAKCADLSPTILGGTFFFSSTDDSRNRVDSVAATIAYQFCLASPILRSTICAVVEENPMIFTKTVDVQFKTLIANPVRRSLGKLPLTFPYVILIDGLDECKDERKQSELLDAIHRCLLADDLPFRVAIASRPEWAILNALQATGHLYQTAYHIELNGKCDASADIERYLSRRFLELARSTGNSPEWPGKGVIAFLAQNASGQFIYAATVIKYISEQRSSPVTRLQAILSWVPQVETAIRPFAGLDALYHQILQNARDKYAAIDSNEGDLVTLLKAFILMSRDPPFSFRWGLKRSISAFLCQDNCSLGLLIFDLRSLVETDGPQSHTGSSEALHFHHKSFLDFLDDPVRSGSLFVSRSDVEALIVRLAFRYLQKYVLFAGFVTYSFYSVG